MAVLPINEIKSKFETGDRPNGQDYADLIDTLAAQATNLGTAGNNEQVITGIESPTTIDRFPVSDWRFIKYMVALSAVTETENKYHSTEISVLIDQQDINIVEYGGIDNDGEVGTIVVSKDDGEIKLIVTPYPDYRPVTVRFSRIGLKA